MDNSSNKQIKLWQVIVLIFALFGLVIAVDQSPYPKIASDWYRWKKLEHDLRCQGEAAWLRSTAIKLIDQPNDRDPITNLSLAYLSPTGKLTTCVSGWMNKIDEEPKVETTTTYQFASVTKVFTADLVLDLIRKDKLSLEDKVVNLLPELRGLVYRDDRVKDIKVKDLLSHRAGFDRQTLGINDDMFEPEPWCPNRVQQLASVDLQFDPGTKVAYSNTGYCILSRIAEEKYQQPYRDIVKQRYQLSNFENFDFTSDDSSLPISNSAIKPLDKSYNYESLASVAGIYGDASSLVTIVHDMEKSQRPNITNRPSDNLCDFSIVKGCHGYMGYEYSTDPRLRFYWRDGSMSSVAALLVIDDKGGVMTMLNNTKQNSGNISKLVKYIYQYRLYNDL